MKLKKLHVYKHAHYYGSNNDISRKQSNVSLGLWFVDGKEKHRQPVLFSGLKFYIRKLENFE